MTFRCNVSVLIPDNWSFQPAIDWSLDVNTRRFGTQSLKCVVGASAGDRYTFPFRQSVGDDIPVAQNTTYTFSGWLKTKAPFTHGSALLALYSGGSTALRAQSAFITDTSASVEGWKRIAITYTTQPGETLLRPTLYYSHADSLGGDVFWWDGVKMEEGSVATAWTPGFVGDAVVLDSNGIAVDAAAGGIMRLRGSAGGLYDVVNLGAKGLTFGEGELFGSVAGGMTLRSSATAFPAGPSTNDLFYRTDLGMWFYYDGARWLSQNLIVQTLFDRVGASNAASQWFTGLTATTSVAVRSAIPALQGGSNLYVVGIQTTFDINAGTALSGSHQWVGVTSTVDSTGANLQTIATITINSGASSTFRRDSQALGLVLTAGAFVMQTTWTKTGTPGGLLYDQQVTYRIIAT
jgi:hypothetical protein